MKTENAVKTPSSEHCAEFISLGKLFTLASIDGLTLTDPWVFVKYIQLPKEIYKIRFYSLVTLPLPTSRTQMVS